MNSQRELGLLTDQDLDQIGPAAVALVPLGSIEPHGHLPLATDTLIPERILRRTLHCTQDTWFFPPIPLGYLFKYSNWPGAVGISSDVLTGLLTGIAGGLARIGIHRLLVMSGHDENRESALLGLQEASRLWGTRSVYCDWLDLGVTKARELSKSRREGHGSELQTSVMLHLCPELHIELPAPAYDSSGEVRAGADELFAPEEGGMWVRPVPRDGRSSYTGTPANASVEIGRLLVEHIVQRTVETIDALQRQQV